MGKWLPGKGFSGDLTEKSLNFFQLAFEDIWNAAGEEGELDNLIDEGKAHEFQSYLRGTATGWKEEKDNYGTKLYKELEWGQDGRGTPQKYRVTVVITSKGTLKIDVRNWYYAE